MNLFNKNFYKFLFSFIIIALTLMVVLLVGIAPASPRPSFA
jgi:hypothetical protein